VPEDLEGLFSVRGQEDSMPLLFQQMAKALPDRRVILRNENHFLVHRFTILESVGMMEYWNVGIRVKKKTGGDKTSFFS
jgi:hypothetical protein